MSRINNIFKVLIILVFSLAVVGGFSYLYYLYTYGDRFVKEHQLVDPIELDNGRNIIATKIAVRGNETIIFGKLVGIRDSSIQLQFYELSKENLSNPIFLDEYVNIELRPDVNVDERSLEHIITVKVHFSGRKIIADEVKGGEWEKI